MHISQYYDTNTLIIKIKNRSDFSVIIPWSDHCAALPGFHAFTGSNYTSSFSRQGKVRPLALLEKNQNAIEMFSKLGDDGLSKVNNVQMPKNLYVLSVDKRNYPLCKKDGWQFFASMFPRYFAETKKEKLRLQSGLMH